MKKFVKTIGIYFIGTVASKLISFLLLPLYTSKILPENYGYFDLVVNSAMAVIVPVLCLEVWTGILRYVFDYQKESDKRMVIANGLFLCVGSFIVYGVGFTVFQTFIPLRYPWIIFLIGIFSMLHQVYSSAVRGLGKNTTFVISGIIGTTTNICSNLLLILVFHMQLDALLISYCLAQLTPIIFVEIRVGLLRKMRLKQFNPTLFKSLVIYCLPLSLNSVGYYMINGFNRVVIAQKLGEAANGVFGIAAKFPMLVSLVVSVFNLAWQEMSYSKGNDDDRVEYYSHVLKFYNRFIGSGTLLLIPVTFIIFPYLIHGDYGSARDLLPVYYLATFFSTLSSFLGNIFCAEKRTNFIFISATISAVVSVALLYTLMPLIGLHAATISLAVSFLVNDVMRLIILRRNFKFRIDLIFFLSYIPLFAVTALIYHKGNIWMNLGWAVILTVYVIYMMRDLLIPLLKKGMGMAKKFMHR